MTCVGGLLNGTGVSKTNWLVIPHRHGGFSPIGAGLLQARERKSATFASLDIAKATYISTASLLK